MIDVFRYYEIHPYKDNVMANYVFFKLYIDTKINFLRSKHFNNSFDVISLKLEWH